MPDVSQAFQPQSRSLFAYRNAALAGDNTPTDAKLAQLQPRFADHLQDLIQDQGADGNTVGIGSGFRDNEKQAQLYQAALAKYGSPAIARLWVAPPGSSNHNRGLAADLQYSSPEGMAAVKAAAPNYGLTFPLGNENWHIEPQGIRSGAPAPAAPMPALAGLAPPPVHAAAAANLAPPPSAPAPPAAPVAPPAMPAPAAPQSNPYASLAYALGQTASQVAEQPVQAPTPSRQVAPQMRDPAALAKALTQNLAGNLTLAS